MKVIAYCLVGIWSSGMLFKLAENVVVTIQIVDGRCLLEVGYASVEAKQATGLINFGIEYLLPLAVIVHCYIRMF